jgi:hypothetical protein
MIRTPTSELSSERGTSPSAGIERKTVDYFVRTSMTYPVDQSINFIELWKESWRSNRKIVIEIVAKLI